MQKPKSVFLTVLFCLVLFAGLAGQALAQPVTIDPSDGTVCPYPGYTQRIVYCIESVLVWAVSSMLMPFSMMMANAVKAMMTLAVAMYGLNVLTGARKVGAEFVGLAVKAAIVSFFAFNFGGMLGVLFSMMDFLTNAASTYVDLSMAFQCDDSWNMWTRVDCAIDHIIGGLLPTTTLTMGILGFLAASIFSGGMGFSIFIMGMVFIYHMIKAVVKCVYIYLMCLIGISFLVCLSPLFVPLLLFRVTKAYFEKWLRLLIGLMMQPVFLVVYLTLLLSAFDVIVFDGPKSIYKTLAGDAAGQDGFRIGTFMVDNGIYSDKEQLRQGLNLNPRELANALGAEGLADTGVFGKLGNKFGEALQDNVYKQEALKTVSGNNARTGIKVKAVDYKKLASLNGYNVNQGDEDAAAGELAAYMIKLMMCLITALVTAYIFNLLLDVVPYIGSALSGDVMNFNQSFEGMSDKLKSSVGEIFGTQGGAGGTPVPGGGNSTGTGANAAGTGNNAAGASGAGMSPPVGGRTNPR